MQSFLDESSGYLTHVVGLLLRRELIETIKKNNIDVTPEQWALLNRLSENQGLTQNELGKMSFKDTANITRMLDKLEDKGLVKRQSNPTDRRIWRIFITNQGKKIRDLVQPLAEDVLEKASKNIDSNDVETYNRVAKQMIGNLER